jgi:hypothetical protein
MTHIIEESKTGVAEQFVATLSEESANTEEQIAAQRQKMYDEVTEKIPTTSLQGTLKASLLAAVQALEALKNEIEEKKQGAVEKRSLIKEKVQALCDSGKVNIDTTEFEKSDVSVKEFVGLLDRMIQEVDADYVFYKSFTENEPPATITVFKVEQRGSFEDVIKERIDMIKRYVKTARRDLAVSYSRYCYGFEAQIRHILYVEQVLKRS